MYKDIALFYEPRAWFMSSCVCPPGEPEMTEFESAFLCGLIKERKPRKIVEVGVAAGGTTAIMLKCIEMLGMAENTEIYSVDLSERFYRGKGESSGYLAEGILHGNDVVFHHQFFLGRLLPEVIDEIGNSIDFLVLDTAHILPGELLDFLTAYPYLATNACVVLHDIANNHYFESPESFATQVLFDAVVADKILTKDKDRRLHYPNIGAFIINQDTGKYISDVFNALVVTWSYKLDKRQRESYYSSFQKHYDTNLVETFRNICLLQDSTSVFRDEVKRQQLRVNERSYTWRVGNLILWIPRRVCHLLRCKR